MPGKREMFSLQMPHGQPLFRHLISRPSTSDGLGPTPIAGLHLATDHYMDGILLAPITAQLMGEAILSGYLAPFQLARHVSEQPI